MLEEVVLSLEAGRYGLDMPKNTWHTIEALESSVIFEVKEGPFEPIGAEGLLELIWHVSICPKGGPQFSRDYDGTG